MLSIKIEGSMQRWSRPHSAGGIAPSSTGKTEADRQTSLGFASPQGFRLISWATKAQLRLAFGGRAWKPCKGVRGPGPWGQGEVGFVEDTYR